jgi:hypothetical protein
MNVYGDPRVSSYRQYGIEVPTIIVTQVGWKLLSRNADGHYKDRGHGLDGTIYDTFEVAQNALHTAVQRSLSGLMAVVYVAEIVEFELPEYESLVKENKITRVWEGV